MTTIAQVRQTVQPLLQRHSDVALVGRYLILKPVHHFVSGVYLERSGNPKIFSPIVDVNIIFMGFESFYYGWGNERLVHPFFCRYQGGSEEQVQLVLNTDIRLYQWDIADAKNMKTMLEVIETALESLRKLTTLEDVIAFGSRKENNLTPFEVKYYPRMAMATALGDFDEAIRVLDGPTSDQRELRRSMMHWHPTFYPALISGDRQELATFLHEKEAKTVKSLKYTKIWERTPFPLELQTS